MDAGTDMAAEVKALTRAYTEGRHDFFFIHYKPCDAAGEDGDFAGKVAALEELDEFIPQILELEPEVLVVAGDHSTPAAVGGHFLAPGAAGHKVSPDNRGWRLRLFRARLQDRIGGNGSRNLGHASCDGARRAARQVRPVVG